MLARVAACRVRCGRSRSLTSTWLAKSTGERAMNARTTNIVRTPSESITTVRIGGSTMPTSGPTTATSLVFSASPNASCQANHAARPSETPPAKRAPASTPRLGAAAAHRFARKPSSARAMNTRRTGRSCRPAVHEPITNPASWAVDTQPEAPSDTSNSSAIGRRRNGVAVKIAVLDAIAASTAGRTERLAACCSRTGTCRVSSLRSRRARRTRAAHGVRRARPRSWCGHGRGDRADRPS